MLYQLNANSSLKEIVIKHIDITKLILKTITSAFSNLLWILSNFLDMLTLENISVLHGSTHRTLVSITTKECHPTPRLITLPMP